MCKSDSIALEEMGKIYFGAKLLNTFLSPPLKIKVTFAIRMLFGNTTVDRIGEKNVLLDALSLALCTLVVLTAGCIRHKCYCYLRFILPDDTSCASVG